MLPSELSCYLGLLSSNYFVEYVLRTLLHPQRQLRGRVLVYFSTFVKASFQFHKNTMRYLIVLSSSQLILCSSFNTMSVHCHAGQATLSQDMRSSFYKLGVTCCSSCIGYSLLSHKLIMPSQVLHSYGEHFHYK